MTDNDKIKEEIGKEIENIKRYIYHPALAGHSKRELTAIYETLNKLLQFIDSLPEENHFEDKSEMVSEGLEEEIENYINSNFSEGCDGGMLSDFEPNLGGVTYCDLANLARHFAEWQKRQLFQNAQQSEIYGTSIATAEEGTKHYGLAKIDGDYKYGDTVRVIVLPDE